MLRIRHEKETEDHKNQRLPFSKDCSRVMKMSWRENQTAQEMDKERKTSLEKMVATELLKCHGDGRRKKSKTEEDGSYHSAEVSP